MENRQKVEIKASYWTDEAAEHFGLSGADQKRINYLKGLVDTSKALLVYVREDSRLVFCFCVSIEKNGNERYLFLEEAGGYYPSNARMFQGLLNKIATACKTDIIKILSTSPKIERLLMRLNYTKDGETFTHKVA